MMSGIPVVNSYDEWSQLREVVVGRVEGFSGFHFDNSFDLGCWDNLKPFLRSKDFFRNKAGEFTWPVLKIEDKIIEELNEDIEGFVHALQGLGVTVRRPSAVVGEQRIQTPFWQSFQSAPLNIRDQTIILGSTIVETAPTVRCRIFENHYLKPLFYEYMAKGARWLCMPQPALCAGVLDPSFFDLCQEERAALEDHHALPLQGLGFELLFDGAQCIRVGKDILVNVANRNHELGFRWLVSIFGDTFDFHRLDRVVDNHIDSLILPLRPGLWLARNAKVLNFLPRKFRNWDVVVAPERRKYDFPSYIDRDFVMSSKFLDMNVLSVNENTVVVNSLYPELIEKLENRGFDVVAVRHRHGRLFGGGFHCFTLDTQREGGLETYS
jgi:glycine amidinotransferase